MANALLSDITPEGVNQRDLVVLLQNIRDAVNEMKTAHAAMLADVAAIRAAQIATNAQLDADDGVADEDYGDNDPPALTAAALTLPALKLTAG